MEIDNFDVLEDDWKELAKVAWECREKAYVIGPTKVGAALLTIDSHIFTGCNVEHRFRCHDVHAEVNAITSMVAAGQTKLRAIVVTAEGERFTPCGGCMDWIFQFGGPLCYVGFQSHRSGDIQVYRAQDLMPYYPR